VPVDFDLLKENERLRQENRVLREEREILKNRLVSWPACVR
jgi:transposase